MKFVLEESKVQLLKERIQKHKQKPGPLMPTLHDAQNIFGCIPIEVQKIISEELDESVAKINGVVTFYSNFSTEPKGKHIVSVCMGTACYVKGAKAILDTISDMLNIEPGQTTKDGLFTLENTRCIGACGLAPVFQIGDKVYGNATKDTAKQAIEEILKSEA
ncbi:MAG TPA: NAD(P)H-dependent oxidoreductase subunit E [Clostridiales bacterium]|jgi:NADH:ubiquinone oxidoreductase subunit E|nr:NAD(P)H-dependent oxidoreductase subunit E [Clostridiales bacterium]